MSFRKKKAEPEHRLVNGILEDTIESAEAVGRGPKDYVSEVEALIQDSFDDADTAVLLHIAEIWNLSPRELFACRVAGYDSAPSNSIIRTVENGWCGCGLYAVAPAWEWIRAFRRALNIPRESTYAKVMGNDSGSSNQVSSQIH